jgi:hypothetical protein
MDVEQAARFRAVVTWFGERIPEHLAYFAWADRLAARGVRFVIMDFPGAPLDQAGLPAVNRLFARIGFQILPIWVPPSNDLKVEIGSARMVGFERKLETQLPGYMVYRTVRPGAVAQVTISRTAGDAAQPSTPVVTGPGGGFAAYGFSNLWDGETKRHVWVLDPFKFLEQALGHDRAPVPDTTTLAGRRIYFSHIDGDAWTNPTLIQEPGRARPNLVSEIVRDRLIAPYPDLPVSIGLVGSLVDPLFGGLPHGAEIARSLYALPQVEVASHTYTHPYDWGFYARQQRDREVAIVEAQRSSAAAGGLGTATDQAYLSGSAALPRANMLRPFDLDQEVRQSLDLAASLAPRDKRAALYLWSGNTRPFAEAIRATRMYGVRNLNGGDGRFDSQFSSISYLSALSRQIAGERQIYAPNANETIYTLGWVAPFDRFTMLKETVANTETPRRLKPWNVYYHMYSGQRAESVAAVKTHLDAARASPVIPIKASHYAAIADGFFDVEIVTLGPSKWRIERRGAVQTVRFDSGIGAPIDWTESRGVLGVRVHAGALYVALDPAVPAPIVALLPPTASQKAPGRPVLVESRWQVAALKPAACGFEAKVSGFGPGEMVWHGLKPGAYQVVLEGSDRTSSRTESRVGAGGELAVTLPMMQGGEAVMKVGCRT